MARIIFVGGGDLSLIIRGLVHRYLPRAAATIHDRAKTKYGIYQPGWKPLAPATLRRKRRRKLISGTSLRFRRIKSSPAFGIGDTPLVDTGRMQANLSQYVRGNTAIVSAPWPQEIHEQDPQMDTIAASRHTPPRRTLLGPALKESIPPIVHDLEDFVARKI